ncbi:MAG: transglutaminase domain-containing protein [Bacteroidota bacterium]
MIHYGIPRTRRAMTIHYPSGNTRDIMRVIMRVVNRPELLQQVADKAEQYRAKSEGELPEKLHQLWRWVHHNFIYKEDPVGKQYIKHPARTYWDAMEGKYADCKSYTVFISMVLQKMGVPHLIRFTSYRDDKRIQHVYPVAIVEGKEIILDAIKGAKFNHEYPYTKKIDKIPNSVRDVAESIAGIGSSIGKSVNLGQILRKGIKIAFVWWLGRIISKNT